MKICPNCGSQFADDFSFCQNCGTPLAAANPAPVEPAAEAPVQPVNEAVEAAPVAPEAPAVPVSEAPAFAPNAAAVNANYAPMPEQKPKKEKKPLGKKQKTLIGIGAAAVAIILVVAIVLSIVASAGKVNNYTLYIKDGELMYSDLSKDAPWQVTTDLVADGGLDSEEFSYMGNEVGYASFMSQDGKLLFFPDRIEEDDEGFTLYYRLVKDPEQEPVKVDSNVRSYYVTSKNTLVYLRTDDDGTLYMHDLETKSKIASNIDDYWVSEDGKTIYYLDNEGTLYTTSDGVQKDRIDGDVTQVYSVSEDYKTVIYHKDDIVYKKVAGSDKVKLLSEVENVVEVYETGEAYYYTTEEKEFKYSAFINDDCKDADAAMTEPVAPSIFDYDTYDAYSAAYDEYSDAYDVYYEKRSRDVIREVLDEETVTITIGTLNYFDGSKSSVVSSSVYVPTEDEYDTPFNAGSDIAVCLYPVFDVETAEKAKLSEISSAYAVGEAIGTAIYDSAKYHFAYKGTDSAITGKDPGGFRLSTANEAVFFFDNYSENEEDAVADLYKMSFAGGTVSAPEVYDTGVYTEYLYVYEDIEYFKNVNDEGESGDLYINKTKIDSDVTTYGIYNIEPDGKSVVYYSDVNDEGLGTLKWSKDGEIKKIADDVYDYDVTPDGDIIYLSDFSTNYHKGSLYIFEKDKARKIDDDVVTIVPVYSSNYMFGYFYW